MRLACARERRQRLGLFLALLIGPFCASAQDDIQLPATIVRAHRIETAASSISDSIELLTEDELDARRGATLGRLLDGLTGLTVRRNGPFGAVETISLGGFRSSHIVVIADGVRLNSSQNGGLDLSLWRGSGFARAEIAGGGYSALYGGDPLGGVVLLESAPTPSKAHVGVETSVGSFGTRGATLELAASGLRVELGRELATNDFPYPRYGDERRRWNADAQRNRFAAKWELPVEFAKWELSARGSRRSVGVPGPDTGPIPSQDAPKPRQWDKDGYVALSGVGSSGVWKLDGSLAARGSFQQYLDPTYDIDGRHRTRTFDLRIAASRAFGETRFLTNLDLSHGIIRSSNTAHRARRQAGALLTATHPIVFGRRSPIHRAHFEVAARFDAYNDFGEAVSPRAGVALRRDGWRLFGNAARSFRAPTFNDLYWQPGGNSNLQAERATHWTIGAGWASDALSVEATRRESRLTDQIRWLPNAQGVWTPRNVSSTRVTAWQGRMEAQAGAWKAKLRGSHADSIQQDDDAGLQAPFIPVDTVSAEVGYYGDAASAWVQHRWVGDVFTRADNRDWTPGYAVLDAALRVGLGDYEARLRVENALGRSYVIAPQYPMPGRSFELTLGANL